MQIRSPNLANLVRDTFFWYTSPLSSFCTPSPACHAHAQYNMSTERESEAAAQCVSTAQAQLCALGSGIARACKTYSPAVDAPREAAAYACEQSDTHRGVKHDRELNVHSTGGRTSGSGQACARARNHVHRAWQRRLTLHSRSVHRVALFGSSMSVTGPVCAACTVSVVVSYRLLSPCPSWCRHRAARTWRVARVRACSRHRAGSRRRGCSAQRGG